MKGGPVRTQSPLPSPFPGERRSPGEDLQTAWFPHGVGDENARIRLFCFAHAGGNAALYRPWSAALSPELAPCPVQLPGHGARLLEPALSRMEDVAEAVALALAPHLDRPFALFGHSMGGLVAYRVALHLRERFGVRPHHLFVSARTPPRPPAGALHRDDDTLIALLTRLGGTPPEILRHPEWRALILPLFRTDLTLIDTCQPAGRLDCPITACGGEEDPVIDAAGLDDWRTWTDGPFQRWIFPGGHFYFEPARGALLARLRDALGCESPSAPATTLPSRAFPE
jgi:medium-chain acyl-[acyl-carrier-protein] hydrolase